LKWNVGISSWGKGEDTLVYPLLLPDGRRTNFSGMICYESAYPNYVREFVSRGAEFLVVLTNDSWWGNTSGAYQHASFASLRAVENRRWIVQCANGGISLIVDPAGRTHLEKGLYTRAQFAGDIGLRSEKTFYVKYGDVVPQACGIISVAILAAAMILLILKKGQRGALMHTDKSSDTLS
jgi:apolipoprotein N-acyltransferase